MRFSKIHALTKGQGPDAVIEAVGLESHGAGGIMETAQTHVQKYLAPLLKRIEKGEIDPSFLITHSAPLEQGPKMYKTFRDKQDGCIKVVLKP